MVRIGKIFITGVLVAGTILLTERSGESAEPASQGARPTGSGAPSARARTTPDDWVNRPWMLTAPAFAIADNLYYVGNAHFSSHLVVGKQGIVLIDTPYKEHAYLLTESIRSVGVNPGDITLILHTHHHYDHIGATRRIKELSHAAVGLGAADIEVMKANPPQHLEPFEVEQPLKHGDTIDLGDTVIHCHHTPGHTPGTMSFTFDVRIDGQRYMAGLFGGPGTHPLKKGSPCRYPGNREEFLRTLDYLMSLDVDIWLGAHPFVNNTLGKYERLQNGEKPSPFIDREGWSRSLRSIKARAQTIIAEE